jgi:hypothetical protein
VIVGLPLKPAWVKLNCEGIAYVVLPCKTVGATVKLRPAGQLERLNVAVTFLAVSISSVHVVAAPNDEQSPPQPVKVEPEEAVAVKLTDTPVLKLALQVAPQVIPPGLLLTEPFPDLFTVSRYIPAN